jgi:hypothetical protein
MAQGWLKWVGIGCGALVVLCVVIVASVYFLVSRATAGPEQVAKDFLSAAASGDYSRAHGFFSAPLKEKQPLEQFTEAVKANKSLFDVTGTTFSERSVDTSGTKLSGTVKLRSGTNLPASFSFVKENGDWKLLGYHLGSNE